jgi:hypothetical protein
MSDLKFQLRLTLSEEAALVARNSPDDAAISSLINILNRHDAVLKCQFDAFAGYVSEAEANGTCAVISPAITASAHERSEHRRHTS